MLTVPEYGCASQPQITAARYGFVRRISIDDLLSVHAAGWS
jgi:hypothetical protein